MTHELTLTDCQPTYNRLLAEAQATPRGTYPKMKRPDIVKAAFVIASEYEAIGLTLSVRQCYYRFVSLALSPNGKKYYDRIGDTLAQARLDGLFPMRFLEDRSRTVGRTDSLTSLTDVDDALDLAARQIGSMPRWNLLRARWYGQPKVVSVWLEKEALSGIYQSACDAAAVGLFACKGYSSVSSLHDWVEYAAAATEDDPTRVAVVLYFGDHDPDGMEIPESAERNIRRMLANGVVPGRCPEGQDYNARERHAEPLIVRFERCGLSQEQIERYEPPPFMAKPTSSRYEKYVERFGMDNAWELDALEPRVMQRLVREGCERHFDQVIERENRRLVAGLRDDMRGRMDGDWVQEALDAAE